MPAQALVWHSLRQGQTLQRWTGKVLSHDAGTGLYTGATGYYQETSPNYQSGPSTAGQSTNG